MSADSATSPITHDQAGRRFVSVREGHEARLDYERMGDTLAITHTLVPDAIGGRGIASELVRTAVEFARAEGLKVQPACSYAETWLRRHPEYDELRA